MSARRILVRWEFGLVLLLVAEILLFGAVNHSFFNLENLLYTTRDFTHIALAALPLTLVMVTAGIDISVASVMGLSSIVIGVLWQQAGFNVFAAMGVALLIGTLAGAVNGLIVATTDIQPLVITLGTLFLYQGIATGVAGSLGASGYEGISGLPKEFNALAHGSLGIVPYTLIFVLALAALLGVVLHRSRFGRSLFLIGVNPEVARFSGIRVGRVLVGAYTLSGLGSALGGVMLTSYLTSSRSDLGGESLLPVITAVVLGGTSNMGGTGTVAGTLIACFVVGVLRQGLLALGVRSDVSLVVVGALLAVTVASRSLVTVLNRSRLNQLALRRRAAAAGQKGLAPQANG
jgi:AI-2 transport system permease protein